MRYTNVLLIIFILVCTRTASATSSKGKVKARSSRPKGGSHHKSWQCFIKGCPIPVGLPGRDGQIGPPGSTGIQGIQGVPGVQGVQGARGPQGERGYKGEKGQKGRRGFKGHKGDKVVVHESPPSQRDIQVAFTVTMNDDIPANNGYKYNRLMHFDVVITNIGAGYDVKSGHFKPPINGTYFFGFGGVSFDGQNILLHLVKDGQRIISAYDNSGCRCCGTAAHVRTDSEWKCAGSSSNGVILILSEGEDVWIELADGYGVHNALYHNYASFYGYLLFQTPPQQQQQQPQQQQQQPNQQTKGRGIKGDEGLS
ncbi:hypothetical protein LSH36_438g01000 [Paralvinella palmiformis]|uniref:C1q domain-containing protein n=1 Tax=Paralvinella palmiformis TaxID=53620 RepID=A0AAD9JBP7_9ANNE|nr:hypothetical protein LSH36_438g01000 [Paralvinella palmiformis]